MRFFSYRHIDRAALTQRLREVLGQETQAQVAKRLGIRQGYVSRYLGGAVPHPEVLAAIAEHYSLTLDWLLLGRGAKSPPEGAYAWALGGRLRNIRDVLGLHPAEFAEALQLSTVSDLEAFERGDREAPRELLDRIAARWNISRHWLAVGQGELFACFGDGSSLGTVQEFRRLRAAGLLDILWVLRASPAGEAPRIGFVAGHEPTGNARTDAYVYYIVRASSSTAPGTLGLAAVKEILCDCWEEKAPPLLGYDVAPEAFLALVQGQRYPATVIPKGAVDFHPIETYVTPQELAAMHQDREGRRRLREAGETQLPGKAPNAPPRAQASAAPKQPAEGAGRRPRQAGRARRRGRPGRGGPKS